MNYGAFSTEKLKKELKQRKLSLKWLESKEITFINAEESMKQSIRDIEKELQKREKEPIWI